MAKTAKGDKALVIVESPAKARTISRYLGDEYVVESSIGHIRDLPSTAAEIPKSVKDEPWARLGVNVNDEFKPVYVVPRGKSQQVTKLRSKLKNADALYLATDEDREGEAIAWHLSRCSSRSAPSSGWSSTRSPGPPSRPPSTTRARSTSSSSTPRRRGASSTACTATRSRRSCGARCGRSSRRGACSPSRRGSSSNASGPACVRSADYWDLEATFAPRPSRHRRAFEAR
jgi:hypothetical protein